MLIFLAEEEAVVQNIQDSYIDADSSVFYPKELIYKLISNREKIENMEKSIHLMCSLLDSFVNEKLSRIKEAFVRKISENGYAEHYVITGYRVGKKQIGIDRRLVSLPDSLQEICFTQS
jgi:hypothetical protein